MAGDGSTKNRSNSNLEDVRGNGVQGMVVVTGELRGKGVSSNLRCLYVTFPPNGVDKEVVSWFQANQAYYPALLNQFAQFVADNWDNLVSITQCQIPALRNEFQEHLQEKCLVDSAVFLQMTGNIICGFLKVCCGYEKEETDMLNTQMHQAIVEITAKSMEAVQQDSFSLIFLKAFQELLQMGRLRIHEEKPENAVMLGDFAGYMDRNFYYLYLPGCFDTVKNYLSHCGTYFPLTPEEFATELFQDGLAVPSRNGRNPDGSCRLNKYCRIEIKGVHGKVNMVRIRKCDFDKALNCESAAEFEEIFRK